MSGQPAEKPRKTPMEDLLDRLRWAVGDLETAASDAQEAANDLRDLGDPGGDPLSPAWTRDDLALAVRDWHDGESKHPGPFVWCAHAVCRTARGA